MIEDRYVTPEIRDRRRYGWSWSGWTWSDNRDRGAGPWQIAFAWLPVRLDDGRFVWLRGYMYRFTYDRATIWQVSLGIDRKEL